MYLKRKGAKTRSRKGINTSRRCVFASLRLEKGKCSLEKCHVQNKNISVMKIGDRVRYLNSVGGGVVSKVINKDMVSVLEDDGFETPVLIRECVVIEEVNEKTNFPRKSVGNNVQPIPAPLPEPVKEEKPEFFDETPEGEKLTVALAFVPQDVKKIQTTIFDWYFVNDSNYSLYYTISAVQNNLAKVLESGTIHLNTTLFLREITKEQLNDFEKINVQFVAFKAEKSYTVKPAVNLTVRMKLVNFYKLHSFTENDYFEEPAMIIPVVTQDRLELPTQINVDDFKQKNEIQTPKPSMPKLDKKSVIEIDLHIHQLLDNTLGLNNADMLDYQMKKFNETLVEYKGKKGQKIVFIHGKGNGVLRNEMLKELKKKYPTYTYQDASFKEYGFGATLITIK